MKKSILALVCCLSLGSSVKADDSAAVANFTYWSYYANYLSYVEGGGSWDSFANAYYTWAAAEQALIADTPEGTQAYLDLVILYGETALFYAVTDWMVNPNDYTYQAMWYAYYSMVAASG